MNAYNIFDENHYETILYQQLLKTKIRLKNLQKKKV